MTPGPTPPPAATAAPVAGPEPLLAGRYRLGGRIGRGGMAEVWSATDERLGRPVAVKILLAELAARSDLRARFAAEARAAAGISHPHAVSVYDTGEVGGRPWLVMEHVGGGTLADRIAAGPVDPVWLTQVLVGVLGALDQAHRAGIVHRDVKPANILLTPAGAAKVADFGIAKVLRARADALTASDLTSVGQLMGTPAYLAPELLAGEAATTRSDIYGVGVVAYEALTGRKPFAGSSALAVALAVSQGGHQPLTEARPDLDPALVVAVERALSPDPARRFSSAAAMAQALPTTRTPPGPRTLSISPAIGRSDEQESPRRPVSTWRVTRWVSAAALAGGLALVGGSLASRAPADRVLTTPTTAPGGSATTAAPATTAPPATTTTTVGPSTTIAPNAIEQLLRDLAESLDRSTDGRRSTSMSILLRRVASQIGDDDQGEVASDAIGDVTQWRRDGDISPTAADNALRLLGLVPGAGADPDDDD